MSETYTIDAKGKKLGRVASEASSLLMGKRSVDFARHIAASVKVEIVNTDKLELSEKKREKKEYTHYTGHPSGLRTKTMEEIIAKKGYTEVVRRAVEGMLPRNKLRDIRMKNLTIK